MGNEMMSQDPNDLLVNQLVSVAEVQPSFPAGFLQEEGLPNRIAERLSAIRDGSAEYTTEECGAFSNLIASVAYLYKEYGESWYSMTGYREIRSVIGEYTLEDVLWGLQDAVSENMTGLSIRIYTAPGEPQTILASGLGLFTDARRFRPLPSNNVLPYPLVNPNSVIRLYGSTPVSTGEALSAVVTALLDNQAELRGAKELSFYFAQSCEWLVNKVVLEPVVRKLMVERNQGLKEKVEALVLPMSAELSQVKAQVSTLRQDNERLQGDKQSLEAEILRLDRQIAALQLQIDHGLTAVDLDDVLKQMGQAVKDLTKERQSLEQVRTDVSLAKNALQSVIEECQEFVEEKDSEISNAINEVKSILDNYEGLDQHAQESITKIQESAEEAIGRFNSAATASGLLLERLATLEGTITSIAQNANGIQANMGNLSSIVADLYVVSSNLHGLNGLKDSQDQTAHLLAVGGIGAVLGWLYGSRKNGPSYW